MAERACLDGAVQLGRDGGIVSGIFLACEVISSFYPKFCTVWACCAQLHQELPRKLDPQRKAPRNLMTRAASKLPGRKLRLG